MAWNSSAAAASLSAGSRLPVVPGFETVLDNSFSQALGVIPALNQKMGLEAGLAALEQAGAKERLQMQLDANQQIAQQQLKQNKRDAMRLAGQGLMAALGSSFQPARRTDPRQMQLEQEAYAAAMRQYGNAKNIGSASTLASIFKGLG